MEKTELHPQIFLIEDLSVKARRKNTDQWTEVCFENRSHVP